MLFKKKKKEEPKPKTKLEEAGFKHEVDEEVNCWPPYGPNQYDKTDWPLPLKRFRLVFESQNASIEETYYWIINHLQQNQAFHKIHKVTDSFTAAENSSFWGYQQQRLGLQQDKVSQYLATIAKMVKDLFSIVREIRILKERLAHYRDAEKGKKAADIALKGYWVDLVEGGTKNAGSVFGLAQQVGFGTLPDLFFDVFVRPAAKGRPADDVDKVIEARAGGMNKKVKEVLRRKLQQFCKWRDETKHELETREQFTIRYLRQHWNSIRLYISWVKPYLKNIKRLSTEEKYRDDVEIISAMEGSIMEIEVLAEGSQIGKGPGAVRPVILSHFLYRTRPQMNYSQEYQRGPLHVGRITWTMRGYAWRDEDIQNYLKYRQDEDIELLAYVDGSIEAAMDALGDDLRKFLEEAEEKAGIKKDEKNPEDDKVKGPSMLEPFGALFGGFKEMGSLFVPTGTFKKEDTSNEPDKGDVKKVFGTLKITMYQTYKNYKVSHGLMKW